MKIIKIDMKALENKTASEYCRYLIKENIDADILEAYRGNMLCMTFDIKKMAKLKLVENAKEGPIYRKYVPMSETSRAKLRGMARKGTTL